MRGDQLPVPRTVNGRGRVNSQNWGVGGDEEETIVELGGHTEDQLRVIKKRIIHKINTEKQVGEGWTARNE